MVTSGPPLSPLLDGFGLYFPVGCAGSHTSLNRPEERELSVTVVKGALVLLTEVKVQTNL